jgi:hypothetical protein
MFISSKGEARKDLGILRDGSRVGLRRLCMTGRVVDKFGPQPWIEG